MTHANIRPGFLITSHWLERNGACVQQLGRFKNVFPNGMRLNTRNLNIARSKYRLNTRWLIETVISHWSEREEMGKIAGVNESQVQWTAKDAQLLHPAFIKVLKRRD